MSFFYLRSITLPIERDNTSRINRTCKGEHIVHIRYCYNAYEEAKTSIASPHATSTMGSRSAKVEVKVKSKTSEKDNV